MTPLVYDAGALIAADRNDRQLWADHRIRLELGVVPIVPAPVVAQVSRSPRQVQLHRLLRGCRVEPFDEARAHRVGALLAKSRTSDVVDGLVATIAIECRATIVTSDRADVELLLESARARLRVVEV